MSQCDKEPRTSEGARGADLSETFAGEVKTLNPKCNRVLRPDIRVSSVPYTLRYEGCRVAAGHVHARFAHTLTS